MKKKCVIIAGTIDTVIDLDKKIAELRKEREVHADRLKSLGAGTYEGTNGVAKVSLYNHKTLKMKKVMEKLSRQFIAANTTETEAVKLCITGEAA